MFVDGARLEPRLRKGLCSHHFPNLKSERFLTFLSSSTLGCRVGSKLRRNLACIPMYSANTHFSIFSFNMLQVCGLSKHFGSLKYLHRCECSTCTAAQLGWNSWGNSWDRRRSRSPFKVLRKVPRSATSLLSFTKWRNPVPTSGVTNEMAKPQNLKVMHVTSCNFLRFFDSLKLV